MTPETHDIAIVLTAAIIVSAGSTASQEASERRQQYLTAARYYAQFAPVFLLENSGYDLSGDPDFTNLEGVRLRPVAAQDNEARGKGYREFHAIDIWYDAETDKPRRFLKITGRYLYSNVRALLEECRNAPDDLLLFDRHPYDRFAVTSVFSVSWEAYGRYLRGLYRQADDPARNWIEHVVYAALSAKNIACRSFRHEPDVSGISGSSGKSMRASRLKYFLKQATRTANRLVDRQYLYFRGETLMPLKRLIP